MSLFLLPKLLNQFFFHNFIFFIPYSFIEYNFYETNLSELVETRLNKPCVIIGPGPTMLDFPYKDFNGTIITIGDAALRGKNIFNPDFWVF